ncbi:hypothetical protein [Atlantibacter hermannii]|uniref:hypothetical protein n=1 Tax=Atlantibacter hermannii TaxID=565 RepID=UPI002898ED93|nr:hypothetical protein [Atlantibacter hermannii]
MKLFNISLSLLLSLLACNSIAANTCTASAVDYPYNGHQEPAPKKAQSNNRIYFYSSPKSDCKTDIFIINGDKLLKYRESNGYSYVNYANKKGVIIDGWVKNEDITQNDEKNNELTYSDFSWKVNDKNVNLLGKATPELNKWAKDAGLKTPDPDNHGFNKGFESWTLTIQNEIVTISQANELIEKRLGFADTYVSAITFVDNKYKTARGVEVGDSWAMVTSKYGTESQIDAEDDECRYYQYFDMKLNFCLDSSNVVQSISFEDYPTVQSN